AQVLRPPGDGLPYLRHDRAGELRAEAGSLCIGGEAIAAFETAPQAPTQIDARGCAVIPGFVDCHTHLPFAGWREQEYARKVAGGSYENMPRGGGRIRSFAGALAGGSDEE